MAQRLELQALLKSLLGSGNVYFQPPASIQMRYPAIIYKRDDLDIDYAGDKPYQHTTRYLVTVVDPDPDSVIHKRVAELPMASYDRFYTADNLNHDVYRLYF